MLEQTMTMTEVGLNIIYHYLDFDKLFKISKKEMIASKN